MDSRRYLSVCADETSVRESLRRLIRGRHADVVDTLEYHDVADARVAEDVTVEA